MTFNLLSPKLSNRKNGENPNPPETMKGLRTSTRGGFVSEIEMNIDCATRHI